MNFQFPKCVRFDRLPPPEHQRRRTLNPIYHYATPLPATIQRTSDQPTDRPNDRPTYTVHICPFSAPQTGARSRTIAYITCYIEPHIKCQYTLRCHSGRPVSGLRPSTFAPNVRHPRVRHSLQPQNAHISHVALSEFAWSKRGRRFERN